MSDEKRVLKVAIALGGVSAVTDGCYLEALRLAGLDPVGLLPGASEQEVRDAVDGSLGLVLTGGADIHPSCYGEEPAGTEMKFVSPERDAMEAVALEEADRRLLPILAICRGMQMLNVHRGGGLLQDIGDAHRDGRPQADKWRGFHAVEVEPTTKLAAAIGSPGAEVNSRHHQAVDPARLGVNLRVIGRCPLDGVIEAVEQPGDRFVVGVQWHPENMALGPEGSAERECALAIFGAFSEAVRAFATVETNV